MAEIITKTYGVPFHAHARKIAGEEGFQGILRMDGITILYTPEMYDTEQEAASAAVLSQARVFRELNSFYGFFGGKDGEAKATATFTHMRGNSNDQD